MELSNIQIKNNNVNDGYNYYPDTGELVISDDQKTIILGSGYYNPSCFTFKGFVIESDYFNTGAYVEVNARYYRSFKGEITLKQ